MSRPIDEYTTFERNILAAYVNGFVVGAVCSRVETDAKYGSFCRISTSHALILISLQWQEAVVHYDSWRSRRLSRTKHW